jgi:hypothetical protein
MDFALPLPPRLAHVVRVQTHTHTLSLSYIYLCIILCIIYFGCLASCPVFCLHPLQLQSFCLRFPPPECTLALSKNPGR